MRLTLTALLLPMLIGLSVGAVVLSRGAGRVHFPPGLGPQSDLVKATVVRQDVVPCQDGTDPSSGLPQVAAPAGAPQTTCLQVQAQLTSGPHRGRTVSFPAYSTPSQPFPRSGGVLLSWDPTSETGDYNLSDIQRGRPLALLAALFGLALLLVGGWVGARALVALGTTLFVLTGFVLPALLAGHGALLVSLVGSALALYAALYITHGLRVQTSIALLGTLVSLALCGLLAHVFVLSTSLTGLGSDESDLLANTVRLDLRGLLLAGVVIGALGALLDMTVTQASAVWELHAARPTATPRQLYRAAMRIGRDHLGAATTTLVLAYAGAGLPLLVLYQLARTDLVSVVTNETVGAEVVRTLVGSVGLVLSVPLTTALAVLAVTIDNRAPASPRPE